jgi:hypothetical protein
MQTIGFAGASMPRILRTVACPDDRLLVARELDDVARSLKDIVGWLVLKARDRGATWDQLGTAFGVT